jgi:ATP-dependent helicase/nuclease subunit B
METDIRPFAPAFALEALAVRLRETKDSKDSFLQGGSPEDALWKNALSSLYKTDEWKKKIESILNGLHVTVPSASITPEQARKLYITHGMTISRVETFSSCPYRHFLQYGLGLVPTGTYAFQRNEQGTFNHDVLQLFLEKAMQLPEWPNLSEETQTKLLNQILKERVKKWEGGILTSDTMHRYQGAGIIRGVRTSIASMMRSFRQKPHFLPMAAEVPFGTPDASGKTRIPAIQIKTADGDPVAFSGRIDRIDVLETADGKKYFMIVDNKMSNKEVRQNSIAAGLQLQLPLYIRAARLGLHGYEAAGGLYQPIRDVLVGSEDTDQINALIDKDLQTSGMILDEELVQEAAKPIKVARMLDTNDTVSAVSAEEMYAVEDCAIGAVADRVTQIYRGEVSPKPVKDGMESPCSWCDHPNGCKHDSTIPGCRIVEINHKRRIVMM